MPHLPEKCLNCGGQSLFTTMTASAGPYGPVLLPRLGGWLRGAKFHIVLCEDCGHVSYFADDAARENVRSSSKWRQL